MPSSLPPSFPRGRRERPRDGPLPCRRCRHRPSTPPCRRRRKSTASPSLSSLHLPSPPSSHYSHRQLSCRCRDRLRRGNDRPAAETITNRRPSVSPRWRSCCPLLTTPAGSATTSSRLLELTTAGPERERENFPQILLRLLSSRRRCAVNRTGSLIFRRISC